MNTVSKSLTEMGITPEQVTRLGEWQVIPFMSEECLSYIALHRGNREALLVDPKLEDVPSYQNFSETLTKKLTNTIYDYTWVAVIDTHTHADHVSAAAQMAEQFMAPLVLHEAAPSTRVDLRVCRKTHLSSRSGPISVIPTAGHTPDSLTAIWGPFAFTGDTVFVNDVGRDDLPGGNPEAHYDSLQVIKSVLSANTIMLPGHDHKGGRASLWSEQLKSNESLSQARLLFVAEAEAFQAPAPKDFKRSLFENLK